MTPRNAFALVRAAVVEAIDRIRAELETTPCPGPERCPTPDTVHTHHLSRYGQRRWLPKPADKFITNRPRRHRLGGAITTRHEDETR